jgi:DNA-binding NtrC family response regulator/tetratricopeptide (TPR) repeat protein
MDISDGGPSASALASQGRFKDALSKLRRNQSSESSSTPTAERIELVELLERTGQLEEARDRLAALKRTLRLSDTERTRCLLVEGLLSKQMGHLDDSIRTFRQACRLAERVGSAELLSWSQLRLLGVSADFDGADFETSLLSDLRRNTERAAVPSVSIAHQIALAEYHAKRGDLAASRHHGGLAESLLAKYPNLWLRGLLDLHLSCLNYLEGNYLESLMAAHRALTTSDESGHLLTGLIAHADMAAAYLAIGQPARARACLSSALSQANRDEQIFGLLIETLAETQLLNGDLAGCSESLALARNLSARLSQSRSAWHRAWNLRTEASLLQRKGQWQESLALIRSAGFRESSTTGSFTKTQLEGLEALALAKLGRAIEARGVIQRLVAEAISRSGSGQGSLLAAIAALSVVEGGNGQSLSNCAQALRVVGATGETSGLVEIVDRFVELAKEASESDVEEARSEPIAPLWRPTDVVCHLGGVTRVFSSAIDKYGELALFVSRLADVATDPVALGEEALRCLASNGWISYGSVVQKAEGQSRTVVSFSNNAKRSSPQGSAEALQANPIQVALGLKQSRPNSLLVVPRDTDSAITNCQGIVRLLATLRGSGDSEGFAATAAGRVQAQPQGDDDQGLFRSPAMLALLASAKRVAPLDITVLLTGESGTGKEVVARIVHRWSGAPEDAFFAFNCATVPGDMVDSQLFGYRRGAFTGAVQGFRGVISAADGGTLLLDEVGELPLETQPKLLRFLDSGEIQALGEASARKVRVRVIAATNADLESLVQQGRFREDLYYRLNVVRFRLPPLRERREEVGPLIAMFLSRYSQEFGKLNVRLSDAAREHLLLFSWPGNIRQLSHEVRRLVALSDSDSIIDVSDLDVGLLGHTDSVLPDLATGPNRMAVRVDRPLSEIIREIESAVISRAIDAADGRLDLAAKRLGLSRKGLYLKRQRLGLA